jgi:hypothetical protein
MAGVCFVAESFHLGDENILELDGGFAEHWMSGMVLNCTLEL